METLQVTALPPQGSAERLERCSRAFPIWRRHPCHSVTMTKACTHGSSPYPTLCHSHMQEGIYLRWWSRSEGSWSMLQPPRTPMDTQEGDVPCVLAVHRVRLWLWHQGRLFRREQTPAKAFGKVSCQLLKTLVASHLQTPLRASQGHNISLSWPS